MRYLLTPALMQRILHMRRLRGQLVSLSLPQEKVHVALAGHWDLFEPNSACSVYSIEQVRVFLNHVRGVLALIDLLHLNSRIWSKR